MSIEYVEQRNGSYYVAGTRISLDSVVCSFDRGNSPEAIQQEYPLLKLPQIYGAIAFYLDHQNEIDAYLEETQQKFEAGSVPLPVANPALWEKLQRVQVKAVERRD